MTSDDTHLEDVRRFVVLFHRVPADSEDRQDHFDLMLQSGSQLLTWALPAYPLVEPCACLRLKPHRLDYLTYQGPISGDRGIVIRRDEGTYEFLRTGDECVEVDLRGRHWQGTVRLLQLRGDHWQAEPLGTTRS